MNRGYAEVRVRHKLVRVMRVCVYVCAAATIEAILSILPGV